MTGRRSRIPLILLVFIASFHATQSSFVSASPTALTHFARGLTFEPSPSSLDGASEFLCRGDGYTLTLKSRGLSLSFEGQENLHLRFMGSNLTPVIRGEEEHPGKNHYLIGHDREKWWTHVPRYSRVRYLEMYPGIDVVFYGNHGELEFDFVVKPGADPSLIRFDFDSSSEISLALNEDLLVRFEGGDIRLKIPSIYQETSSGRKEIMGTFEESEEGAYSFRIADYDRSKPLIIDPILSYSSYLGGSGFESGQRIAVDPAGMIYVTGDTTSMNFPTGDGISTHSGQEDVFVAKFDPSKSGPESLIFSTYIGGSGIDAGRGIAVNSAGEVYVCGSTFSDNFPTANPLMLTDPVRDYSTLSGRSDGFVLKLNSAGSDLLYSTYLGGERDDSAADLFVDIVGELYVAGTTASSSNSEGIGHPFPITDNALLRSSPNAVPKSFVTKLNSTGSALVYSTFIALDRLRGGPRVTALEVDDNGNAYITGLAGTGLPGVPGAFQTENGGLGDVFLLKLNPTGTGVVYATFLGGSGDDSAADLAIDDSGNAYITGRTGLGLNGDDDFPTTVGAYDESFNTSGNFKNGFAAKIDTFATGDASLVYSTILGGTDFTDEGNGIDVDNRGNAFIVGQAGSTDFPTVDPIQEEKGLSDDVFVAQLNPDGSDLIFSTFIGGNSIDRGRGIAVDGPGSNIYLTGESQSSGFPTTEGAFQPDLHALEDAFVVRLESGEDGCVVNSTGDASDMNPGDGVCATGNLNSVGQPECTLRAAIEETNANEEKGSITFNIPGPGLFKLIAPETPLPPITKPVTIDGTSQDGFAQDFPVVILEGDRATSGKGTLEAGLRIESGSTTIRGFAITNWPKYGIHIAGLGGNRIEANLIGLDPTSATGVGNRDVGVFIENSAQNTVGGDFVSNRNVISGNGRGVRIEGQASTNNRVLGNYIGTNTDGTEAIANRLAGVFIFEAGQNRIGGVTTQPGFPPGNLISGNDLGGVDIASELANGNMVQGNLIGLAKGGMSSLPNKDFCVRVSGGSNNLIGGEVPEARNVIAGPGDRGIGVRVDGELAMDNKIRGNFIGTDIQGMKSRGFSTGVQVIEAKRTSIGGIADFPGAAPGNVISGNDEQGVELVLASESSIQGNLIGTDSSGETALPNGGRGILDGTGEFNTIGGAEPGARNVISGNGLEGILFFPADSNVVQGNYIGTDITGFEAIGNGEEGVRLIGFNNRIGGPNDGAGNVVSGNEEAGIFLAISTTGFLTGDVLATVRTTVQGNLVGVNRDATLPLRNEGIGIYVTGFENSIGGMEGLAGNIVSSSATGILIEFATNTTVVGNYVGTDRTATLDLGCVLEGILIRNGENIIGPENTIMFNRKSGIRVNNLIAGNPTRSVLIQQNSIAENGNLGISLALPGNLSPSDTVVINDATDADIGANGLQNHPEITSVLSSGSNLTVEGFLQSIPESAYGIEIFSNLECDPTGFGEGLTFLGDTLLDTDETGRGTFSVVVPFANPSERFITATAINRDPSFFLNEVLNTSEFSSCFEVDMGRVPTASPTFTLTSTPTATPTFDPDATATPLPEGFDDFPDTDNDGRVGPKDLLEIILKRIDVNQDGEFDEEDLFAVGESWGSGD